MPCTPRTTITARAFVAALAMWAALAAKAETLASESMARPRKEIEAPMLTVFGLQRKVTMQKKAPPVEDDEPYGVSLLGLQQSTVPERSSAGEAVVGASVLGPQRKVVVQKKAPPVEEDEPNGLNLLEKGSVIEAVADFGVLGLQRKATVQKKVLAPKLLVDDDEPVSLLGRQQATTVQEAGLQGDNFLQLQQRKATATAARPRLQRPFSVELAPEAADAGPSLGLQLSAVLHRPPRQFLPREDTA